MRLLTLLLLLLGYGNAKAIDLQDVSQLGPFPLNFCNDSSLLAESGLRKASLGQFLGYPCSPEFFHCRWQSAGFLTFKKVCSAGLVFDTEGTQNCNYDYNVRGCSLKTAASACKKTEFACPFSDSCVPMARRCDGTYDCVLEEDEQNCPMCAAGEFACVVSEQCVGTALRCNGVADCADGTDEMNCEKCGNGGFYCAKSDECIRGDQRCDGIPQCALREDEGFCKAPMMEKLYTCEDRRQTVTMKLVCDGVPDCHDGSDEKYCTKPSPMTFSSLSPMQNAKKQNLRVVSSFEEEVQNPVFPVVPSASLPNAGISRGIASRPRTTQNSYSSGDFASSTSDSTFSAYSIPHQSVRSGLTNNMDTEFGSSHSESASEPVFPLKIPQVMTVALPRAPAPTTKPSFPTEAVTRKATVTPRPSSVREIPSYTGQSGRKNFSTHRVVVEVTSRPPTTVFPKTGDDDLVRQITERLAKSNSNSARDLLHMIESMLNVDNSLRETSQRITITRPPSRKWRPSLSNKNGVTAAPPKAPSADRRMNVFMRQYDTVSSSTTPIPSESAENE